MLGEAEVAVPARDQNHVICQVFALNFQLLHDDNIRLEHVEHVAKSAVLSPRLVAKRVADAIDIPRRDANHSAAAA
jgi:hypothetical protein